jgi:hypothetical protein
MVAKIRHLVKVEVLPADPVRTGAKKTTKKGKTARSDA